MSTKSTGTMEQLQAQRQLYAILRLGATTKELAMLFRIPQRTVEGRLAELKPVGKRKAEPTYEIDQAAPYLVKPNFEIEQYIRNMRPQDLPPLLQKEYWNGKAARLRYEEAQGLYWHTDKVSETLTEAFKTLRMSILLLPDTLERAAGLDQAGSLTVREACDTFLESLRDALVIRFESQPEPRSQEDFDAIFALPEADETDLRAEGPDEKVGLGEQQEEDHGL